MPSEVPLIHPGIILLNVFLPFVAKFREALSGVLCKPSQRLLSPEDRKGGRTQFANAMFRISIRRETHQMPAFFLKLHW